MDIISAQQALQILRELPADSSRDDTVIVACQSGGENAAVHAIARDAIRRGLVANVIRHPGHGTWSLSIRFRRRL